MAIEGVCGVLNLELFWDAVGAVGSAVAALTVLIVYLIDRADRKRAAKRAAEEAHLAMVSKAKVLHALLNPVTQQLINLRTYGESATAATKTTESMLIPIDLLRPELNDLTNFDRKLVENVRALFALCTTLNFEIRRASQTIEGVSYLTSGDAKGLVDLVSFSQDTGRRLADVFSKDGYPTNMK